MQLARPRRSTTRWAPAGRPHIPAPRLRAPGSWENTGPFFPSESLWLGGPVCGQRSLSRDAAKGLRSALPPPAPPSPRWGACHRQLGCGQETCLVENGEQTPRTKSPERPPLSPCEEETGFRKVTLAVASAPPGTPVLIAHRRGFTAEPASTGVFPRQWEPDSRNCGCVAMVTGADPRLRSQPALPLPTPRPCVRGAGGPHVLPRRRG